MRVARCASVVVCCSLFDLVVDCCLLFGVCCGVCGALLVVRCVLYVRGSLFVVGCSLVVVGCWPSFVVFGVFAVVRFVLRVARRSL